MISATDRVFSISPAAVNELKRILVENAREGVLYQYIRLFQVFGAMAEHFGVACDNDPRDNDYVFDCAGLKFLIDKDALPIWTDAVIEFVGEANAPSATGGFRISNPTLKLLSNIRGGGKNVC